MSETNDSENVILYDTSTYLKWTSEINLSKHQDLFTKFQKNQKNNYNYAVKFGVWLKSLFMQRNNENALKFLYTSNKPWNQWKLVVSKSNDLIAVLQENYIEVYKNFDCLLWRVEIQTEFVKVCNIYFNRDDDMLVYTNEAGNIYFFDVNDGTELLKYIDSTNSIDYENAICKMFFMNPENFILDQKVFEIIFSVTYSGFFSIYSINMNQVVKKIYNISLLNIMPSGIYCAEMDSDMKYLILGGFASNPTNSSSKNVNNGLFLFRILNDEPWIKKSSTNNENLISPLKNASKLDKKFTKMNFSKIEYITKMEIAPDNSTVAVVYVSGKISLFAMPSMMLINEWFITEQPSYNEINSEIRENPYELKMFKQIYSESDFRVVDIGWWSQKVLIITRGTGLLSLASSEDLSSYMGNNQQWLSPYPAIYSYSRNGFIILDCSCSLVSQSDQEFDHTESQNSNESNEDADIEEDDDSWYIYIKDALRTHLYNLSGFERLKLKERKPKFLLRKFSLMHFKSTTPEELFERKLNSEEYGEALQLAKSYKLDTDLVYQKQWRSKPITKATIMDYLSKIKKRSWILHECLTRVSTNIDTTKYLINFGLRGTDIDSLINLQENCDNRFFLSSKLEMQEDDDEDSADIFNADYLKRKRFKLECIVKSKLEKINLDNITVDQEELLHTRIKLLKYMDLLNVYEQILGGPLKAAERFCPEKFQQIRSKSLLDVCLDYAHEGDSEAVNILFIYYHKELKGKQLEIIGNFSETIIPDKYARLLPKIECDTVTVFEEEDEIRVDKDWIESEIFREILDKSENKSKDENLSLDQEVVFEKDTVQQWYYDRTIQIENTSGLVDIALNFAELAITNGCQIISEIAENLRTLYTLIYVCQSNTQNFYTLEYIMGLSELEKLTLIMSHSYETNSDLYMNNLKHWLIPFIMRRPTLNQQEVLMRDYLLKVSKEELNTCLKLFQLKLKQANNSEQNFPGLNLINILIDCLYVNEIPDQVYLSQKLINDIILETSVSETQSVYQSTIPQTQHKKILINNSQLEQINIARKRLKACEMFKNYGVNKTLSFIGKSCSSKEMCRDALVKLTWSASKRTSSLKTNEWIQLMKDLQYLQSEIYKDLISYQECTEIFVSSLLGSRNSDNIKLAAQWLQDIFICDKEGAVNLIVKASQEYFNASANYFDPDMEFSKACLELIQTIILESQGSKNNENSGCLLSLDNSTDPVIRRCRQVIEEERDLIASMKLIAGFEYNILPVQVRINTDRLSIIKSILKNNCDSYKDHDNLLKLASFLKIGSKESQNQQPEVMLMIAEHSLEHNNLQVTTKMSVKLIELNFNLAWSCVYNLALSLAKKLCDQFKIPTTSDSNNSIFDQILDFNFSNIASQSFYSNNQSQVEQKLREIEGYLAFVVTHCDSEIIANALNYKLKVEKAVYKLSFSGLTEKTHKSEQIDFGKFSHEYFGEKKQIGFDLDSIKIYNRNVAFEINKLIELNDYNYQVTNLCELAGSVDFLFSLDINLGLGILLEFAEKLTCLESLTTYDILMSYELVLYQYGLSMLRELSDSLAEFTKSNTNDSKSFIYYLKPESLLKFFDCIDCEIDKKAKKDSFYNIYKSIYTKYVQYKQNKALKDLNSGIDLKRFESDNVYKNDTIIGLSMDTETFELACSLARFYSFDIWRVYMAFTEFLLTDNEDEEFSSLQELENRLNPLAETLRSRKKEFLEYMNLKIMPVLDGKSLDKLIVFYNLLGDEESIIHVKTLKKLKSISLTDLDYKKLLVKPLEVISEYLDDTNLNFFSKLLPKLQLEQKLTSSKIHVIWCLKNFWMLFDSDTDALNDLDLKADRIMDNLKKLDLEEDFVHFVLEAIISQKSCLKLNIQVRKNLSKKFTKFLKQEAKTRKLEGEKIDQAIKTITNIQAHFKNAENLYEQFNNEEATNNLKYATQLELALAKELLDSCSENKSIVEFQAIDETLIIMLHDGMSIKFISKLLTHIEQKSPLSISLLVKKALSSMCLLIKEEGKKPSKRDTQSKNLLKLNSLLNNVSDYLDDLDANKLVTNEVKSQKKKKVLANVVNQETDQNLDKFSHEDVMECMRVFCNDQQVDINLRLLVLEELKVNFKNMDEKDLLVLLSYKTNAILKSCHQFNEILPETSSNICSEPSRLELIMKLIDMSRSQLEFDTVINLIKIWPHFKTIENLQARPHNIIIIKMLKNNMSFVESIKELKKIEVIKDMDIEHIKEQLETDDDWLKEEGWLKIEFLKLAMAYKNDKILKSFLRFTVIESLNGLNVDLENMDDIEENNAAINRCLKDKELISLILEDNTYITLIQTPFYLIFIHYILKNEPKSVIYDVVRNLRENNFLLESSKVFGSVESFCGSYKTVSSLLALVENFK